MRFVECESMNKRSRALHAQPQKLAHQVLETLALFFKNVAMLVPDVLDNKIPAAFCAASPSLRVCSTLALRN